jgi:Tfp pilus assembly protein PilV
MARSPRARSDAGFSLVEAMVASLVLTIGLVGLGQLLAVATVMHSDARQATTSTTLAQQKIDELTKSATLSASLSSVQLGSLASNMAPYFDEPANGVTRRWQINDGPVADTWILQVKVINKGGRLYGGNETLTTVIRQW